MESPETETRASVGFGAGVRDHRFTDWTQEYGPKETSISETGSFLDLIPFSHEGILFPIIIRYSLFFNRGKPLLLLLAALSLSKAAESSTGTWTTVWYHYLKGDLPVPIVTRGDAMTPSHG